MEATPIPQRLKWSDIPVWVRAIWLVTLLNGAAFFLVSLYLGGDAVRGVHSGGKYWLEGYGHTTEVSFASYRYSQIHAGALAVTFLLSLYASTVVGRLLRKTRFGETAGRN